MDRFIVEVKPGEPQPDPSRERKRKKKSLKFYVIEEDKRCN